MEGDAGDGALLFIGSDITGTGISSGCSEMTMKRYYKGTTSVSTCQCQITSSSNELSE